MAHSPAREIPGRTEPADHRKPAARPKDYGRIFNDVELSLIRARTLIDATICAHRSSLRRETTSGLRPGEKSGDEAVRHLVAGAERRIGIALSGRDGQARWTADALSQRSDRTGDTVEVQLLCTPTAWENSLVRAVAQGSPRCEVRIAKGRLPEALVVDGRAALLRTEEESAGPVILEDPTVARALDLLFAGVWRQSAPPSTPLRLGAVEHQELRQRILGYLCAGHTDEAAARLLRISLRTYRRHVAEIMRGLGVNSRFQAGVRAVELELLPEDEKLAPVPSLGG